MSIYQPKLEECVLWKKPELIAKSDKKIFKTLITYSDTSHFGRDLLECIECGQLYMYEFYEHVDWLEGNDKIYVSYIPVQSENKADLLKDKLPIEYLGIHPKIRWDYDDKLPRWVR